MSDLYLYDNIIKFIRQYIFKIINYGILKWVLADRVVARDLERGGERMSLYNALDLIIKFMDLIFKIYKSIKKDYRPTRKGKR